MAKRTPGWKRILDAFLTAPGRKLSNVELGEIEGVQAWHQRITDLRKKGYRIDLHRLAQKDRAGAEFVYTLVGLPSSPRTPRGVPSPAPAEPSETYAPEARTRWLMCDRCDTALRREPVPLGEDDDPIFLESCPNCTPPEPSD